MTVTHFVLRYAHISMGMLALFAGAAAMISAKGSLVHRRAGNVFFVAMMIMAGTGTFMSVFLTPDMGNVMGGSITLYLVATAWLTVKRPPGETGGGEIVAGLGGLTVAVLGMTFGMRAAGNPSGVFHEFPAGFYFTFGSIALLATLSDARMIAVGGLSGAARTTRHLWRMCAAMFMATASFFLGQAKLFPAAVRESGVLAVPVLLVIGALIYWLLRVRLVPGLRRSAAFRAAVDSGHT